jgi:hypothetical protein
MQAPIINPGLGNLAAAPGAANPNPIPNVNPLPPLVPVTL